MADINYLGTTTPVINLGKITRWQNSKESSLTPIPLPGQNSHFTEAVDTLGVIKFIKIEGRMTGSDTTTGTVKPFNSIQDRIWIIEDIIDGMQTGGTILWSPFVVGNVWIDDEASDYTKRMQGGMGITTNVILYPGELHDSNGNFIIRGIKVGDMVRNKNTQEITTVTGVPSATVLYLDDDIMDGVNEPYEVTAQIRIKIQKFETRWELPGLSFCDYSIDAIQVK